MSAAHFTALETLNGSDTVEGSLAKAVKDLNQAVATAKADAIKHTDDLVGEVEEGKTVVEMINAVSADAKTYSIAAASAEELATLGTNVKEAYKLVDEDSAKAGEWIKIYKDSSISEIYLGSDKDTVDASTGVITKNAVAEGKDHQSLNYVYIDADGKYNLVSVDVTKFLAESEFKDGLEVNSSGEVSVKIASDSESFLSVDENGVKISGVQQAIEDAIANLDKVVTDKLNSEAGSDEVEEGSHVAIKITQVDGVIDSVTLVEDDIASAQGLSDEIDRAKKAEDAIEAAIGLAADGSHVTTSGNYTSAATTIAGEIAALDAQVKLNADAIAAFTEGDNSVDSKIQNAIEALDSTQGSATVAEGTHVAVQVVQEDGLITSVSVAEDDIASAQALSDEIDRAMQAEADAEANAKKYTDEALTWWEDEEETGGEVTA
jgi:hypothetical protein